MTTEYQWLYIARWMSDPLSFHYVNEDCPDSCSTEHDVDQYEHGVVYCPETGREWFFCVSCYEWKRNGGHRVYYRGGGSFMQHDSPCVGPDGDQRCESCHGETFSTCDSCYGEVYREDLHWHESNEEEYCDSCYSQHPERGGMEGTNEPVRRCTKCNTPNVHLAMLPETFHCDCEAHALQQQGQPVVLARPLLKVPVLTSAGVRYHRVKGVAA